MATTSSPCGPDAAVRRAAADILAGHRSHLQELRIEVVEGGVVIRGRAVSFYGKQIAFHEVTRRFGRVLANEVEVQPQLTESAVRERHPPLPSGRRMVRWRCAVSGQVQGVGFRPYVCGLARCLGVTGFVGTDAMGVFVEVQGTVATVAAFTERLKRCPAPAAVRAVSVEELQPRPEVAFVIAANGESGAGAVILPDLAMCDDCLRDLSSPGDRRLRYPSETCARCGLDNTSHAHRSLPFAGVLVGFNVLDSEK